jgi:cation transport ATPase
MSWFTDLFSGGASKLVGEVRQFVDDLHTSDEEKIQLKNQLENAIMSHNEKQMEMVAQYDKEITDRHKNDMASDSWLSKNIRPLTLAFLTVTTVLLAYLTVFILPVEKIDLLSPWITLLTTILVTAYTFYFGSRGIEKYKKISKE